MPFHIPESQMNGYPLPPSSHLSLLFSYPHLHTVPASFPQLLSLAGHTTLGGWVWGGGGAMHEDWSWERREGGGDMDVMRAGDSY